MTSITVYDHVRRLDEGDVDFSMDTTAIVIDKRPTWCGATFSRTLWPFYGVLIIAIFVVTILV